MNDISLVSLDGLTSLLHPILSLVLEVFPMRKKVLKDVLNWLLSMSIISNDDYNRIYLAALPYLK